MANKLGVSISSYCASVNAGILSKKDISIYAFNSAYLAQIATFEIYT